jgi:hypothetical protein
VVQGSLTQPASLSRGMQLQLKFMHSHCVEGGVVDTVVQAQLN